MKEVMISIQPKWVEKIVRGEKTVEVRKTKPKLETPFKVYIYETQGRTETPFVDEEGHHIFKGRGEVIGEFVCDKIEEFSVPYPVYFCEIDSNTESIIKSACLKPMDIHAYNGVHQTYAWHITDLIVYDEPRELSEFLLYNVRTYIDEESGLPMPTHEIARPFQSWGYVKAKEPRQTAD